MQNIFDLKQVLLYHKVKGRTKCLKETGKPNTDIGSMFPRICSNFSGALKAQRKKSKKYQNNKKIKNISKITILANQHQTNYYILPALTIF